MSNTQTFKVVGITVHGDDAKVRFTDDMVRRIKQFTKGGATRRDFIELPTEMNKLDALRYLAQDPKFQSEADQATIADAIADREKEASKGTVKVKNKAPKVTTTKSKPSIEAIKGRLNKSKPEETVSTEFSETPEVVDVAEAVPDTE